MVTFHPISIKNLMIYINVVHSAHVPVTSFRFITIVCLFSLLCDFSVHLLFGFCFIRFFCFFIVFCSLVKEKRFNSDPGLYSRYFEPVVREVPAVPSPSMQVNKHHTSHCTDFVIV
jgi:hypothetical protein